MTHIRITVATACLLAILTANAQRTETTLKDNWQFHKGDVAASPGDIHTVTIPHDWAIYGPFSRDNDLQVVAVTQNGETEASVKTGRTGGLPYVGVGTYETEFTVSQTEGRSINLLFDGAMSEAQVYVNGRQVAFWPYGYNSFYCNIDSVVRTGSNKLRVRLENREQSSRWYSGAGLYRNVHLISTDKVHVPIWGTQITTPYVSGEYATVKLRTAIDGIGIGDTVVIRTTITDMANEVVAVDSTTRVAIPELDRYEQNFVIKNPQLWTPETPSLYKATSTIYYKGKEVDEYVTRFGARSIEFRADNGFYLNGQRRKFQGVSNHHDLGALGAAVNKEALRHQLTLLKDMGVDAIRTAHNMPAPELVELCDEMGFMLMAETFDEWDVAKCENGYHRYFGEWAERDIRNVVQHYRNNPSVVMWSIGNEIPSQWMPQGRTVAKQLVEWVHALDPTRPVTVGMDQVDAVVDNGFASIVDIPGLNYRTHKYMKAYDKLPQKLVLGSETASTVSSRGVYKFPVVSQADAMYSDNQSSSYDVEYCSWSNIPDEDFALADDYRWTLGQFVWTGFDYLGEPSPYDTDAWPSHSSVFGIIDLAALPKDRYYLYRSQWNKKDATLHILPHWNWSGREGEVTPIFVYTSYPKAELFINGKSQGIREKNDSTLMNRYRLMWNETRYEPGEVRVVAYDNDGNKAEEKVVKTAGKAYALKLEAHKQQLQATGEDVAYVTVTVVDKDGNAVPTDSREISFKVSGAGQFRAAANGDATCLYPFHEPRMPLFSGACTAIVQSTKKAGTLTLEAKAKGVKPAKIIIDVK